MNILVLADTHLARANQRLPSAVFDALPQADLILHAGDITHRPVLQTLERHAPVTAVAGNNDEPELLRLLPKRVIVPAGAFRIGVVHGDGARGTTFERAQAAFAEATVDCVVFGHSHQPRCQWIDGRLYLNPGSPTQRRREPQHSYAWLQVGDRLEGEIVRF